MSSVDEFDTFRGGIRLGFWIRPELKDLSLKVPIQSTAPANVQTLPREFDAKDVGLDASDPTMADVVNGVHGAPTGELFLDTRWISLSLRGVAPFQYKGTKTFTAQTLKVGNLEIAAGALVKSKLILWLAGFDVAVNILNDQYVRVGPVIGLRALGLHASVTGRGSVTVNGQTAAGGALEGGTDDAKDFPLKIGRYVILPYPEVGAELRVGYRTFAEVDVKITGMHIPIKTFTADTLTAEAGVTVYPFGLMEVDFFGIRVGGRFVHLQVKSKSDDPSKDFNVDMRRIMGAEVSFILRF